MGKHTLLLQLHTHTTIGWDADVWLPKLSWKKEILRWDLKEVSEESLGTIYVTYSFWIIHGIGYTYLRDFNAHSNVQHTLFGKCTMQMVQKQLGSSNLVDQEINSVLEIIKEYD